MGHFKPKLDIIEHIPENLSHMRGIEWFYEEVFLGVYGGDIERDSVKWKEAKNKMQMFSVAYELAKHESPETFKGLQGRLEKRILSLKCKCDLSDGERVKEFNDIISLLLEDIYIRFERCGNLGMLQNIIGGYVNNIGKYKEDEFKGCIIKNREKVKNDVTEVLNSSEYLDLKNKEQRSQLLLEKGISYKRGVELYYEKIKDKCFREDEKENNPDGVAAKMQMFNLAYTISKYKFQFVTRKSGERYFEHLLSVVDLYLENEKYPTFKGVMVALLHDIIEDSDIDEDTLRYLFGYEIAHSVSSLSKRSVYKHITDDGQGRKDTQKLEELKEEGFLNKDYQTCDDIKRRKVSGCLDDWELKAIEEYDIINKRYKFSRNKEYFEHFKETGLKPDATDTDKRNTRIKIYDRIHNTMTLPGFGIGNINKIFRKIDETIDYFLPITAKYYPELNEKLIKELEIVLDWLIDEVSQNSQSKSQRNKRKKLRKKIRKYKQKIRDFKTPNKQVEEIIKK